MRLFPNIIAIKDPLTMEGVTILPWLVGDEWRDVPKIKSRYIFGHFELPSFYMNAMVQMPDHGQLQRSHFQHQDYVFSGHFHKRQQNNNIVYIGNAFPHNYADAGDDDRGMMMLEWGGEPQYLTWDEQPTFQVYRLSDVISNPSEYLKKNMHAKVNLDVELSYEESTTLRDELIGAYGLRELIFVPQKNDIDELAGDMTDIKFESVDSIIKTQIGQLQDGGSFDKKLLLEIYNNL
jgi:hypothetical protein